jgi:uncharacterized protein YjlB
VRPWEIAAFHLKDDGLTPNHPCWPLLVLWCVVRLPRSLDPAVVFEGIFARNGWTDGWRDGVYDYLHYHSRIHEVMGLRAARAKVRFDGKRGQSRAALRGEPPINLSRADYVLQIPGRAWTPPFALSNL